MNKNFYKSYEISKPLYERSFQQFASGTILELLFIKVINLYLLQIGMFLGGGEEDLRFKFERIERNRVINELKNDEILNKFENATRIPTLGQSSGQIPSEILYNNYLTLFTNREVIYDQGEPEELLTKFDRVITSLIPHDLFDEKLVDLYTFQVLPCYSLYSQARHFISNNSQYSSNLEQALKKLNDIETDSKLKLNLIKQAKELAATKLQELQKLERERLKEAKKEESLKYKTLSQIRKEGGDTSSSTPSSHETSKHVSSSKSLSTSAIVKQLRYHLTLSKDYLVENAPILLVVVVALLVGTRFLRKRKISIKEKFLETIRMAFKVSYL